MKADLPERIRAALKLYVGAGDRGEPPVFVGREDELRFLRDAVALAKDGRSGLTSVVQGPPGAGKTALCRHFERELEDQASAERPVVLVRRDTDFLAMPPLGIVREINSYMPILRSGLAKLLGGGDVGHHIERAISATTVLLKRGSSFDLLAKALNLNGHSSFGQVMTTFAASLWPAGATIVLTIDEMQTVEDTPRVRSNLSAIHQRRFDANIVLLSFGLQNTGERLRELGLSRLSRGHVRSLAGLKPAEADHLVDATFEHLGLSEKDADWCAYLEGQGFSAQEWTRWRADAKDVVLEESADFPQHLNASLAGLCETIMETGLPHPGDAVLPDIRRRCGEYREEYYLARLAPFSRHLLALGAALSKADEDGWLRSSLLSTALKHANDDGDAVDAAHVATIQAGLLSRGLLVRRGLHVAANIPSLSMYLRGVFDEAIEDGHDVALGLAAALGLGGEGQQQ